MSDDRMFERDVQTWLELGPSQAPARAVQKALQVIDTTPQQRDLRILWRFPQLTMNKRLATAAVVALVVVAAGVVLLRNTPSQIGNPSPSPSASPTASPSAISLEDLRTMWASVGTRAALPGTQAGRQAMTIDLDGLRISAFRWDLASTTSLAADTGTLQLQVSTPQEDLAQWDCRTGDVGSYTLGLSPDDQTLTMTSTTDSCASRAAILTGSWTRWPCHLNYGGYAYCPHLTDQAQGHHVSDVFRPFRGGASGQLAWTIADSGWVTLTVPPSWPTSDTAARLSLYRPALPNTGLSVIDAIKVFSALRPISAYIVPVADAPTANCSTVIPSPGHSPAQIADWLESLPYLSASNRKQVTIGGLSGEQIDISLVSGFVDPCTTESSPSGVQYGQDIKLFVDMSGPAIVLNQPDLNVTLIQPGARLIILDAGDTISPLVIEIPSPGDGSDFEELTVSAMSVIDSFELTR